MPSPPLKPCSSCGYQPITPETPAWDDPGNEKRKNQMTKPKTKSRRESQLDRIERKLDELLKRQTVINITPRPGEWYVPYQVNTPTEQPRYPTDTFGQPVPYAVSIGGAR